MKETEKVCDFYTRVAGIVNQIKSYGETIADKKIVEKICCSHRRIQRFVKTYHDRAHGFS